MLGKLSTYFISIFLFLLVTVALLVGTPWGSRLSVALINNSTALAITYQSGVIANELKLSTFALKQDGLVINATDIDVQIQPACLWLKKLCIDELNIKSIQLMSKQQGKNVDYENKISSSFSLPNIKANKIFIENARVVIDNTTFKGERISTGLSVKKSAIALLKPTINSLEFSLANSTEKKIPVKYSNKPPSIFSNLPLIHLPLHISIINGDVKHFIIQPINGMPQQQFNENKLTVSWQASKVDIKHLKTQHSRYGALSLQGFALLVPPYQLNLISAGELKNITSLPLLDGTKQKISLIGDLSALNFSGELSGNIVLSAQGKINLVDDKLPFNVKADIKKFPDLDNRLQASKPTTFSIDAHGDISKQQFTLNGLYSAFDYQEATLTVNARHQQGDLIIQNFVFKDRKTKSELTLHGKVNYINSLSWNLNVSTTGFTLPKVRDDLAGRLSGNVHILGELNKDKWWFTLNDSALHGTINDREVSANGHIKLNDKWQLFPSELTLKVGNSTLKVDGYTDEQWHIKGAISIPTLQQLLVDSHGDVTSSFEVNGLLSEPNIDIKNHLHNFYWNNFTSPDLYLSGHYRPMQLHNIDMQLKSEKFYWQDIELSSLSAKIEGDETKQLINIDWLGDVAAKFEITGKWIAKTQEWQAQLNEHYIKFRDKQWQADNPIEISYSNRDKTLFISQHCWLGKSVRLCSSDDINIGKSGEIKLQADIQTKDIGDLFLPKEILLTTKSHSDISLQWSPEQPLNMLVNTQLYQGQAELVSNELNGTKPIIIAWKKGEAVFQLNKNILSTHLFITAQHERAQPLLNIETRVDLANQNQLSGKMIINDFNLLLLQPYFSEISQLDGLLNANLDLNGVLSSPTLQGKIDVSKTSIKAIRSPTTIDDLHVNIEMLGKKAHLIGRCRINQDITNITGEIDWQNKFNALFNINANKISINYPPQVEMTIAPNINVAFSDNILKLTGAINIKEGSIVINKLPEDSVSLSNDVMIVNDNGKEVSQTTRIGIETDIHVDISDNIKISGYGFNGILGGQLNVKQEPHQATQLFGNLNIIDGLYRAYGQRLAVSNGRISFNGPMDNPLIDLHAVRHIVKENVSAGLVVYGPAKTLTVNLFSTPVMPKSEILSYITRGRGLSNSTPSNGSLGVILGATLANASGILEKIEKLPLINNLEIDGDEEQASIAGYVGDNVYIKYGRGVAEPINELTVRFYLLNRLWLETVTGIERSVDLYFSFDVD